MENGIEYLGLVRPSSMIRVEPASERDIGALCGLLQELFAVEEDFSFDAQRARPALAQLIAGDRAQVLVARNANQAVGMCTAQLVVSTAAGGYSAWVEDVVVDSRYRGAGIGRQLLDAIEEWAKSQGATRLQLLADTANQPALRFYRRNRWQPLRLQAWRK
jgi:GNAT superfamily N-acetyltransferase